MRDRIFTNALILMSKQYLFCGHNKGTINGGKILSVAISRCSEIFESPELNYFCANHLWFVTINQYWYLVELKRDKRP